MKKLLSIFLAMLMLALPLTACTGNSGAEDPTPTPSDEPTAAPTDEPTPEPTATSTPEPTPTPAIVAASQERESVVMAAEEWNTLRFKGIVEGTLIISSTSDPKSSTVYKEGVDYEVDYAEGKIRRLAGSSIPDFSQNSAYGAEPRSIDLGKIDNFGTYHCGSFTVYATYDFDSEVNDTYEKVLAEINAKNETVLPLKLAEKIKAGGTIVYGVVGDSISTGAEASKGNDYFSLFKAYLESLNENLTVEVVNVAVGGAASSAGNFGVYQLYEELGKQPDFMTVAYGMNDQNSTTNEPGTSPEFYVSNINDAVIAPADYTENLPEVAVITSMPANPVWNLTSGGSVILAESLRAYAKENNIPIADVNALFDSEIAHGQTYEELITSLINHPGNYGHYLYFLALKSLVDAALAQIG